MDSSPIEHQQEKNGATLSHTPLNMTPQHSTNTCPSSEGKDDLAGHNHFNLPKQR
jgi:hypothetical protein